MAERPGSASYKSLAEMWEHRVESTPESEALQFRRDGTWVNMTWKDAGFRVRALANALLGRGLRPEDRVVILSETRVEWVLADFAVLCAGGATTTLHTTSPPEECAYILADCEAVLAFCDTPARARQLVDLRERVPSLKGVVVFDGDSTQEYVSLRSFEEEGRRYAEGAPSAYDDARRAIGPDQLATLIYTSGTTGDPKGVMLTHDAWVYAGEALDALSMVTPADKQVLFLPLSHVYARLNEILFVRLGLPTVLDGDLEALVANAAETRPTFVSAVPRVFDKAWARLSEQARAGGSARATAFDWAFGVGQQMSARRRAHANPGAVLRARWAVADRLVFQRIKARFGGRLRFLISGGAPLSLDVALAFHAVDILICEGYGLTECAAIATVNPPDDTVFGTVGKPVAGTELKIAEDGEILLRSRAVMKGYYKQPEATAEVLDAEGWLHTGDIGQLLPSGHLQITDRKKDVIITSGGKNIAPARLQALITARCPYVSHVIVHGDRRPYCVALVALSFEPTARWARDHQIAFTSYADLALRPEVHELVRTYVEDVNREVATFETIKRFALLPMDLSTDDGTLTPSLKVKRKVVEQRHQAMLDSLYATS